MKKYILLLIIFSFGFITSCNKGEDLNETNLNTELEMRFEWGKFKKFLKVAGADAWGGANGVCAGACVGSALGPEGTVIGGMIGGVVGFCKESIEANGLIDGYGPYPNDSIPFADTIGTKNKYEYFGILHNQLINAAMAHDFSSKDELFNFLIDTTIQIFSERDMDLTYFSIDEFKTLFENNYNSENIDPLEGSYIYLNEISNGENIPISENEFELFYKNKVIEADGKMENMIPLAVLHHSFYYWKNKYL